MQDPTCAWTREAVREPEADEASCRRENLPQESKEVSLFSIVLTLAASVMGGMDLQGGQ